MILYGRREDDRSFRPAQWICVLICAYALKHFYSTAEPDQLRWILAPTARIIQLLTGVSFAFEPGAGYLNREHLILIAPACSGINFLITAFVMLSFLRLAEGKGWLSIPASALMAYAATLLTNAVRITLSMQLQKAQLTAGWLDAARVHRIEGIVIYFGFLLVLFVCGSSFRRNLWIPVIVYYIAAIGVPFLNGAFRQGSPFWEHIAFVFILPMLVLLAIHIAGNPLAKLANLAKKA